MKGRVARPPRTAGQRSRLERGAVEHYADPAYYTLAYRARRQDVDFYLAQATRSGGPVLEYGVGNGRVALPLARAGIDIVGLDLSKPMLADLARRAKRLPRAAQRRLRWVRGDMRDVRLDQRFRLVIAPFNTVLHLYERSDVERFLACVRDHLAPGAPLVFDLSVPSCSDLASDPDAWRTGPPVRLPGASGLVRYRERFEYDALRQVLAVDMEFKPPHGQAYVTRLAHRQFFPCEIEALLHYGGFQSVRFTADFTSREPNSAVDSLVVEARRQRLASGKGRS